MDSKLATIERTFGKTKIRQREVDGYLDATAMCKATGKRWADYIRVTPTLQFLAALSSDVGRPTSDLVQVQKGNPGGSKRGGGQGTWVHPQVAVHLAQWASPEFAVMVSRWVLEILTKGHVGLRPHIPPQQALTLDAIRALIREEVAQARVATPALPAPGGPTHPGPWVTVEFQLTRVAPQWKTEPRQRRRISYLAKRFVNLVLREDLDKYGRENVWYSHQVYWLDQAISQVRREEEAAGRVQDYGLFKDAA